MDIRGSNYLVLPKRFYGDFIRNTYPAYPKHEFEADSMVSEEWSFPPWSASAAVRALPQPSLGSQKTGACSLIESAHAPHVASGAQAIFGSLDPVA